jgi:wobble nucleotide-excising tRNase
MPVVRPNTQDINKILEKFGFVGFRLQASKEKLYYSILRSDGTTVGNTLSEGEKTFIAFLYFYHLLNGSQDENDGGINSDRIVVFDDPISSLDSNRSFVFL